MRPLIAKLKPRAGLSHVAHLFFTGLIPILIYAFVQWGIYEAGLAVIILSKWRMFAVQPRHWWPNIRANAVDLLVGVATLAFMIQTGSGLVRLLLAAAYGAWLIFLKPRDKTFFVSLQALIGQTAGLMALYLAWGDVSLGLMVIASGLICYVSARHFFTSFDEPHAPLYAHAWGYFGAAIAWILGHWLLFYSILAQPVLLLTVLGFGLAGLYHLEETDKLSVLLRRQFIFIMVAVVVVVLVFSDWSDKAL